MYYVDYTGRKYGKLTVLNRHGRHEERKRSTWLCKCDCGNTAIVVNDDLRNGNTKSCGCMSSRNFAGERTKTHGMSSKPIYNVWRTMRDRCENPNNKSYKDYGGRGITFCDKWKTFEGFYEDMGDSFKKGLTIERIDSYGDYCLENCEWIAKGDQALNRRCNIIVEFKGVKGPLKTVCREFGLSYKVIHSRIKRGWESERAMSTPIRSIKNKA